jgi:hypothetical protein
VTGCSSSSTITSTRLAATHQAQHPQALPQESAENFFSLLQQKVSSRIPLFQVTQVSLPYFIRAGISLPAHSD